MEPTLRTFVRNDAPVRPDGRYVLYWMIANRRVRHNASLDRALAWARDRGVPLVVFEPLRVGYRWASVRFHRFVVDGMIDNAARCAAAGVTYLPYVEPSEGHGKGLLDALAEKATVVVTDHFPCFFLPRMVEAAAASLDVRLEAVDGNGILPLREHDRDFTVAHSFRRHLQKRVGPHLDAFPDPDPLEGYDLGRPALPEGLLDRWPAADLDHLRAGGLADLPIDQEVGPTGLAGGSEAAEQALADFVDGRLGRYHEDRNDPADGAASGLSPYLHWGHLGAHEVVAAVLARDDWSPACLAAEPNGKREGWWGASPEVEAFLDEVITWRELGFGFCHNHPDDYDDLDLRPDWAVETLRTHASDPREHVYTLSAFERAETHDPIWNAAQRQLVHEGIVHNYLRMLWGKKVLHWTDDPQDAVDILVELNNRYALDGRDPNSYTGIFWCFGRFDRAWGPERPIFGKVRYMTSDSTARKLDLDPYLERWGPDGPGTQERA